MSGKQALIAALAATITILSASAEAQDYKSELTGILGATFISDQGVHGLNTPTVNPFVRSGHGITFEINYARVLLASPVFSVSAELPVVFNLDEDLGSGGDVVPPGYRQVFVTPSARLNLFPETAVSPWVSLGAGLAHFSESSTLIYAGTNPGGSSTSGVLQGGIGLDVRVCRRFSIRGQGRDFWSGTPDLPLADTGKTRQHNYFVGAGVVYHF
ncbi:MAG TPA: hypothetical protein VN911_16410 [Candidatus Acidoferrum sp.]|nr:hypothetical protein [Candidatus Acidoferrum sp.]